MKIVTNPDVQSLEVRAISVTQTEYDWDKDDGRHWSIVQPNPSSLSRAECMATLAYRDELEEARQDIGDTFNVDLWRERIKKSNQINAGLFCPMVEWYYDIPDTDNSLTPCTIQHILRHLPIIVVLVDGKPKLSCNVSYTSVSVDICKAFLMLGYLPPLSAIDLPNHCREVDSYFLDACERTLFLYELRCTIKRNKINKARESLDDSLKK